MVDAVLGDARSGYRVQGSLTYDTVPQIFERELEFAEDTRIDLSLVSRIDSAGLAMLVEWVCIANAQGKRVILENLPESLAALIEVSGLGQVLPVSDG